MLMLLQETASFQISIPQPFNFSLTVSKPAGWSWSTPEEIFENNTLWSGLYLGSRPLGIKLQQSDDRVNVVVYSKSSLPKSDTEILKRCLSQGLGAEEDLSGFYEFAKKDPVLSITIGDLYGMRVGRLDDVFGRVILSILLQMAPIERSNQMMDAVLKNYGTKISFDDKEVILWPKPGDVAKLAEEELRVKAKLGYRAKRLIAAANFLSGHPIFIEDLAYLSEEEALKRLEEIPGIGEYSAAIIFSRSSAPLDVWSVVIMSELLLGRTPENPRIEIANVTSVIRERWGKWSWIAFVYILNDLDQLAKKFKLTRLR
jgi:DNA-3-methyladenine glycosylase II